METATKLEDLRQDPEEWHRRGMYHPDELEHIVRWRLNHGHTGIAYADFFAQHPAAP
ncbi:hypothetical protein QF011_003453 [Curtobacterium flaccumfaciens]|nr:hypothetical protein [Curtobacterium flaccumfaciens]MDQ0540875.1 hypothetical protein [Curtobacterium flaccumfaciens]